MTNAYLSENLGAFLRETLPLVQELDNNPDRWDQTVGNYSEHCGCCIGAHLANHFGVSREAIEVAGGRPPMWAVQPGWEESSDWERGVIAVVQYLDCDESELLLLLRNAGAPDDPFSSAPWPHPASKVWANMAKFLDRPS